MRRILRIYSKVKLGHIPLVFLGCMASCNTDSDDPKKDTPVFELINAQASGIDFENHLTYTEEFNVYLYKGFYNGSGVGLGDLNSDGLLDIFFSGNQVDNKCYLNMGDFKFMDVTAIAGVASPDVWSTGVSIVDVNGDGKLDVYVCKSGNPEGENRHNELFINQGNNAEGIPIFKESAEQYGINDMGLSVHATFFDMDKDGDLDMYLLNNSIYPTEIVLDSGNALRQKRDKGESNKLYRNEGAFFTDVSEASGIYGSVIGYGLGVSIGDVNRDTWPDIYVANDFFERDYLYINKGDGTFTEQLEEMMPEISQGAMGVDIADMNHDGYPDIYVTEMLPKEDARRKTKVVFDSWDTYKLKENKGYHRQFPRNSFQWNRGGSSGSDKIAFSEISRLSGMDATDWSWGVLMADFDNNGQNEIFVTNGIFKDLTDGDYINFYSNSEMIKQSFRENGTVITKLIDLMPSVPISNHMYTLHQGMDYRETAMEWGMDQRGFSTGSAFGDLDNDGDLDLVVTNINMPPFLYKNTTSGNKNHFLNVSLTANTLNTHAIGSQVTLWVDGQLYFQELYPNRGSMSTVDNRLNFGLGNKDHIDSLRIVWPNGHVETTYNPKVNEFIHFKQPETAESTKLPKANVSTRRRFKDVTHQINIPYTHRENNFVDFNNDKLLYHMISNEGPKLAVSDVNNDGYDDFYVGGAKGFPGVLYLGDSLGRFIASKNPVFDNDRESEDTDAIFVDLDNDGDKDLLVASGGYEFSRQSLALADRMYLNDGKGNFTRSATFPSKLGSTSCYAISDYDNDGDMDVFVGGRVVPLAYGIPANSYLLQNDGTGKFDDITIDKAPALVKPGMVTDATWFDYDQDGDDDLFLCGEWMPIRGFKNEMGKLVEITEAVGLRNTNGFWNTLALEDLDGDGDMDMVAGNLGLNTGFRASAEKPVSMLVNDFDQNGKIDHVISIFNGSASYPIATKTEITAQMPYLLKKYLKYDDYKEQTVTDIFTPEQLEGSLNLKVFETASIALFNENGIFKVERLPTESQIAPTYSILIQDFDNDGTREIIMGGNQYKAKPQVGIYASSYGTFMEAGHDGNINIVDNSDSGFFVQGEIRDIKTIRIAGEHYVLVARNDDTIKVFKQIE